MNTLYDDTKNTTTLSFLVIIPALNESGTIGKIVESIDSYGFEVVVVDDHSTDETMAIARSTRAKVIQTKSDAGYSAAILTGLIYSHERAFSHIITIDADGAHDTRELANIVKSHLASGCELTIGDRFSKSLSHNIPSSKVWANHFAATLVNIALDTKLSDVACGFRVLSSGLCNRLIKMAVSKGYGLAYEMIAISLNKAERINSFPVSVHYDASCILCTSQTELTDFLKTMVGLTTISKSFARNVDKMILSVERLDPITVVLPAELICLVPLKEHESYVFQKQDPVYIENKVGCILNFKDLL